MKITKYCQFISILLFAFYSFSFGQEKRPEEYYSKYFLIDDLAEGYDLKSYTLNTKELYGIDKKIEIFNLLTKGNGIILVSALPNLWENKNWIKIDYNLLKNKVLTKSETNDLFSEMFRNNNPSTKTMNYGIIKKINNEYFIPTNCLLEIFQIGDYENPLIVPYGTINIKEQMVTIKGMQNFYKDKLPKLPFPLDLRISHQELLFNQKLLARNYFSGSIQLKNETAFKFWTFDSWRVHDGYNEHRGIDRFVYVPGKGIIGGSYDFYFIKTPNNLSYDKLWDNIINEKVMIAEELK
ncbi:hypothetical protein KRE40_15890 [Elizabethkingia meningoseptica]|uniref:hypothetical protein n=1 Tax=Elizabethkingia meningoseptica TaxID=238 RepID=UPI0023AE7596|nr:hypothetical protein [Elizabethkingia meningoseptica]MDE5439242.1 hypothetical protein [Elizabethkingia meningoseptica]MDE5510118.1 hypothetical protein [Elizabethkingia meningoseptica]MDE5516978.1 hypothetical protein [Elizabethkingia meningoseptica]MDE5527583.1 hypothetical protein [Elizabethkingia meningoseptica]MDE5531218.1 hypothetical protein [Elizabethkingia meningoseptica]